MGVPVAVVVRDQEFFSSFYVTNGKDLDPAAVRVRHCVGVMPRQKHSSVTDPRGIRRLGVIHYIRVMIT